MRYDALQQPGFQVGSCKLISDNALTLWVADQPHFLHVFWQCPVTMHCIMHDAMSRTQILGRCLLDALVPKHLLPTSSYSPASRFVCEALMMYLCKTVCSCTTDLGMWTHTGSHTNTH
eukprot:2588870-Amphidinium_carterae.1